MNTMNTEFTADHYFAALKLIEQLYKDGEIPAYMFRNILKDYADVIDDENLVRHINLALMHIVQHFLDAFSPNLTVAGVTEQADADYNVPFQCQLLLRFHKCFLEPGAATQSNDFVFAYHHSTS